MKRVVRVWRVYGCRRRGRVVAIVAARGVRADYRLLISRISDADQTDPHLMIYIIRGRLVPDLYDLHSLDHFAGWGLYGTTLARVFDDTNRTQHSMTANGGSR